jgi:hypothetical protein
MRRAYPTSVKRGPPMANHIVFKTSDRHRIDTFLPSEVVKTDGAAYGESDGAAYGGTFSRKMFHHMRHHMRHHTSDIKPSNKPSFK